MTHERCYEAREEREPLDENARLLRQRKEILDDEPEALALEAVKRVAHHVRGAEPPLVHVHRCERVEERRLVTRHAVEVPGETFRLVEAQAMRGGKATSNRRLAAAATSSDESDVAKSVPEHVEVVAGVENVRGAQKLTATTARAARPERPRIRPLPA